MEVENKIVTQEENGIQYADEKALAIIEEYDKAEANLKALEKKVKAVKDSIYKNMEQNGVKSFEVGDYKFTYVAPTDTMVINTQKLKDEGMYEYFKDKPQHRSGYVKYTRKKAEATA